MERIGEDSRGPEESGQERRGIQLSNHFAERTGKECRAVDRIGVESRAKEWKGVQRKGQDPTGG